MKPNYKLFKKTGKKFTMSSGKESEFYYDIKEMMGYPEHLSDIIAELKDDVCLNNVDVIIGLDYGGIPLAVALSMDTKIPYAVLRKSKKKHGTERRLEGNQVIGNALLLDDVRNSGETFREAIGYLESMDYNVVESWCCVRRDIEEYKVREFEVKQK